MDKITPPESSFRPKTNNILALMTLVGALAGGPTHAQSNPDPVYLSVGTKIENITRPTRERIDHILDTYGVELGILGGVSILGLGIAKRRKKRLEPDEDTSFLDSEIPETTGAKTVRKGTITPSIVILVLSRHVQLDASIQADEVIALCEKIWMTRSDWMEIYALASDGLREQKKKGDMKAMREYARLEEYAAQKIKIHESEDENREE